MPIGSGIGHGIADRLIERIREGVKGMEKGEVVGFIIQNVVKEISPLELAKVIFTPDNMRAFAAGLAEGAVKGAKTDG